MFAIKIQDPIHPKYWIIISEAGKVYLSYKKDFISIEKTLLDQPLFDLQYPEAEIQMLVKTINTKLVRLLFE
jgi:hypothetical protein